MVCGCNTKIILIYGVIKLNFGVTLEYCIESLCNIVNSKLVDVTCLITQQLVTYTACIA